MKILILGGYGVFGGRLALLLSDLPDLEMIIAGRSLDKARRFCRDFPGPAKVRPLQLDRADIATALAEKPDLVVDASGPFQNYGDDPYGVVKACIEARIDYLDFADAADFVFGISKFDTQAKAAGVFVLAGVSSFPVLTAAVLRDMADRMEIVSVDAGIAPSPYAGIGLNVMRAVLGYAGEPVKLVRGGVPTTAPGLAESRRFTVAVPGRMPLRNLHFSLVDVPDLQVLPPEHTTMQDIWVGAGPVPEILHRALNLFAKARARFGLPNLSPLSGLFYNILNAAKFGEHRGGMFVRARGVSDGAEIEESWHLLAEGDDGPFIPSMAVEGIVRRMLADKRPENGARSGVRALNLSDYAALFEHRQIYTGFRKPDASQPLCRQLLGTAFDALPGTVRDWHSAEKPQRWTGEAEVQRGSGILAGLLGKVFRFPPAAKAVPVSVELVPVGNREVWTRNFGGKVFSSVLSLGRGRNEALLVERFGPFSFGLALVVDGNELHFIPRRWTCLGLPMPRWLLPNGACFETEIDGVFHFDVEIALPLVGRIVAYRGKLSKPE